jgi:hypothetical protein
MKRFATVFGVIIVALILMNAPAKAQFGIYGGVALPIGDFADENKGMATLGFGGGLEYNMSLPTLPLGWVTSLSATYNGLKSKNLESVGAEVTQWLAAWPMTGIRASIPALPIYAQVQVGIIIALAPEISYKYNNVKLTEKADPAAAFGFSAGVGAGLGPVKIFARYMSGKPEFKFKVTGVSTSSGSSTTQQEISVILITVGIEL